jgi:hypothetical protein
MRFRKLAALGAVVSFASLITLFSGCTSAGVFVGDSPVMQPVPAGPPPHAPAYGYRAKHTYYYYPETQVYYDVGRGVYFYYGDGNWQMSVSLPSSLSVQLTDHVTIDMDTDRPYIYSEQHREKYPPGQMKDKKKGKK